VSDDTRQPATPPDSPSREASAAPTPFERCALQSGLLAQEDLAEARRTVFWSDGESPAERDDDRSSADGQSGAESTSPVESKSPRLAEPPAVGGAEPQSPKAASSKHGGSPPTPDAQGQPRSSDDDGPTAPSTPPLSDEQLAERLVEMGRLNRWQAKQLLNGQTRFTLGSYQIVDSLGQGGMGQVFKARHAMLGREVAIKVLPRDKSTPKAIESFQREMQALARLNHPSLVAAVDAGFDGNVYYLVTDFVPGADLYKLVRRRGPLEMAAAARIISDVADGLDHAHQQGMVHRDIKPGNVLVMPDGRAKLADLGLVGMVGTTAEMDPRHGRVVGTADYIAPDHIDSPWEPSPLWDIYSLGGTLYFAVTGSVPFPGGSTADKARAHRQFRPVDPRRLNPALNSEFVELMARMMAKNPRERIASAADVIAWLEPFLGSEVADVEADSASGPFPRRRGHGVPVPPPLPGGRRRTQAADQPDDERPSGEPSRIEHTFDDSPSDAGDDDSADSPSQIIPAFVFPELPQWAIALLIILAFPLAGLLLTLTAWLLSRMW